MSCRAATGASLCRKGETRSAQRPLAERKDTKDVQATEEAKWKAKETRSFIEDVEVPHRCCSWAEGDGAVESGLQRALSGHDDAGDLVGQ